MFLQRLTRTASPALAVAALLSAVFLAPGMTQDSRGRNIPKHIDGLWSDLADPNRTGDRAQLAIIEAGDSELPHFATLIRLDHHVDANRIAREVGRLNSDDYPVRKLSTEALLEMGPMALPHLRPVLAVVRQKDGPREVRVRLRHVVRTLATQKPPADYRTRYSRLVEVSRQLRSFPSLRLANEIYEITPYDEIRSLAHRQVVQPLSMALYNLHLQNSAAALDSGKLAEARQAAARATKVADLIAELSGELARSRLAYVKQLEATRRQIDELKKKAIAGDKQARASLQRSLLGELGDTGAVRQWLPSSADSNTPVAVLSRELPEQASGELLRDRALAAEQLLKEKGWSEFAQVRLARWARDAWQARSKKLSGDAESEALERARSMDARIRRFSASAAVMGITSNVQEFGEDEIAGNLKPVRGLVKNGGKSVVYVTPTVWRRLSPIPNSGQPWGKADPPEKQFVDGSIDFSQSLTVGKKTASWQTVKKASPPFNYVQPARRSYFYFYTEIRVDSEGLRPCLLGVDDAGTVWVNGKKALATDRTPRGWKVDTLRSRITLRRGLNRILIRLENIGGGTGMSFLIGTKLAEAD